MTSPGFTPVVLALPTLTPSLAIEVLPHGVTVHRIYVQADGKTHDLLIGPENANDFLSPYHKYHNTIVGRYTNRIPVGTFELERNGFKSELKSQGNQSDPSVSLHGGPKGFDDVDWEVVHPMEATLFSDNEKVTIGSMPAAVVFRYTSPDGDQGFPGALLTEVLVGLINPGQTSPSGAKGENNLGSILFVYRAKLLDENKVTPINLTQHWGFNLEASIQGDESNLLVKDHRLNLKAGHNVACNDLSLSVGKLVTTQGTAHEHNQKLIGDGYPENGYDDFYVFEKGSYADTPTRLPLSQLSNADLIQDLVQPSSKPLPTAVEISSVKSGLKLDFLTNQSGVQFYSGIFIEPSSARKKIHGGSGELGKGDGYKAGAAAFLEFHEPLAAFLHPQTSLSGNDTLLASGELYNNFTKVEVFYKSEKAL